MQVDKVTHALADARALYDKCVRSYAKYEKDHTACSEACIAAKVPTPPLWDSELASGVCVCV